MSPPAATVVLISPARPHTIPASAVPALRAAGEVYAAADVPDAVCAELDAKPVVHPDDLAGRVHDGSIAVVARAIEEPATAALIAAGARVIQAESSPVLRAVDVMDRLRSPGGCPWDAVQTHASLRQYLVEETYELLDAIEDGDRGALREELGDVLLQVLFHARLAAEDAGDPFDIADVASGLVAKLVGRHPYIFADGDSVDTAEHQQRRWEELKQTEKRRESIMDGVALGQPAVALAGKLGQRTGRAGLPFDLIPAGSGDGEKLFRVAAAARRAGTDPEGELRAVAKSFESRVRAAENAARADGVDPASLDADGWRRYWQ